MARNTAGVTGIRLLPPSSSSDGVVERAETLPNWLLLAAAALSALSAWEAERGYGLWEFSEGLGVDA